MPSPLEHDVTYVNGAMHRYEVGTVAVAAVVLARYETVICVASVVFALSHLRGNVLWHTGQRIRGCSSRIEDVGVGGWCGNMGVSGVTRLARRRPRVSCCY